MNFQMETTQKGKPCLVFNNNKYRESRMLVTGEVFWRCLGRTCGSSVKTNAGKTEILSHNGKHSGEHPVTMRSRSPKTSQGPGTPVTAPSPLSYPGLPRGHVAGSVNVTTQTDEISCKYKDELVAGITQWDSYKIGLIDKIQGLTTQLDELKHSKTNENDVRLVSHTCTHTQTSELDRNPPTFEISAEELNEIMHGWLSDADISLYIEELLELPPNSLLLGGAVSLSIKNHDNPRLVSNDADWSQYKHIFAIVNNGEASKSQDEWQAVNATHWSLLCFDGENNVYYHWDSISGTNAASAKKLASKINECRYMDDPPVVREVDCIQQVNGRDCGIHTLKNLENACWLIHLNKPYNLDKDFQSKFNVGKTRKIITKLKLIGSRKLKLVPVEELKLAESVERPATIGTSANKLNSPIYVDGCKESHLYKKLCICEDRLKKQEEIMNTILNTMAENKGCSEEIERETEEDFEWTMASNHRRTSWNRRMNNGVNRGNAEPSNLPPPKTSNRFGILAGLQKNGTTTDKLQRLQVKLAKRNMTTVRSKSSFDNEIKKTKLNKVHLYADSHGKELSNLVDSLLPSTTETFVSASGGGIVKHILSTAGPNIKQFNEEDTVIIIAGANDFSEKTNEGVSIPDRFHKFALENSHTNVAFVAQFHRYDLPSNGIINQEVKKVNNKLREIKHIQLINVTDFSQKLFESKGKGKGLHLNKKGKQILSRRIADAVLNFQFTKKKFLMEAQTDFKVLEADMKTLFDQHRNNPEVAFAHCISADFDNEGKHMSQGVAVVFKENFGKPCQSDYCGKNLTYQKTSFGASVYSLVTKPKYFLNANNFSDYKKTYDAAFSELIEDFKKRNFKMLICSPLGCIRDRILPPHFVSNLMKFRENTGASIRIVTSDDTSKRNLRNGLPFKSFLKSLQQASVNECFRYTPSTAGPAEGDRDREADVSASTLSDFALAEASPLPSPHSPVLVGGVSSRSRSPVCVQAGGKKVIGAASDVCDGGVVMGGGGVGGIAGVGNQVVPAPLN